MDTKELLLTVLSRLAQLVGAEVAADSSSWSRAVFWLHDKTEGLDWTVGFHLKPVWGEHFKHQVPSALLTVCELPEQVGTLRHSRTTRSAQRGEKCSDIMKSSVSDL